MADKAFSVRTEGLGKLNRDLGKINKTLRRDSLRHLREVAKDVRNDAKAFTPVYTGALQSSLRYSARNTGATVYSNLPYAPVLEYGGNISPRGAPIAIPRYRMVGRAVQKNTRRIEDELGDLLDGIARRNGFH